MITDNGRLEGIYSFITNPGTINPMFLGLVNLAVPSFFLAILAGVFQFIQGKLMMKTSPTKTRAPGQKMDIQKTMTSQMTYFMPLIIVFISLKLPAGLPLYWAVTTLFGIGEYLLINRKGNLASKTT
jgi:YidC/Oxa1 family membrane protein insertase